jgi:hypothetical protein
MLRHVLLYKVTDVSETQTALMMEAPNTFETSVNFYKAEHSRRQPSSWHFVIK